MLWEGSDLPSLVHCAELALGAGAVSELKEGEREHPPPARPWGAGWGHASCQGAGRAPPAAWGVLENSGGGVCVQATLPRAAWLWGEMLALTSP